MGICDIVLSDLLKGRLIEVAFRLVLYGQPGSGGPREYVRGSGHDDGHESVNGPDVLLLISSLYWPTIY
jgi:hypothetical protein